MQGQRPKAIVCGYLDRLYSSLSLALWRCRSFMLLENILLDICHHLSFFLSQCTLTFHSRFFLKRRTRIQETLKNAFRITIDISTALPVPIIWMQIRNRYLGTAYSHLFSRCQKYNFIP